MLFWTRCLAHGMLSVKLSVVTILYIPLTVKKSPKEKARFPTTGSIKIFCPYMVISTRDTDELKLSETAIQLVKCK